MAAALSVVEGDITTLAVDAIVNAANAELRGGGGVDGAIHRAAGPGLMAACREIGGCPTGQVRVTPGFDLPARYVFHAVGPIWQGGDADEDALLTSCYTEAIREGHARGVESLAFPAISTGVYGFPAERAAGVAVAAVRGTIGAAPSLEQVIFCCFSAESARLHENALSA